MVSIGRSLLDKMMKEFYSTLYQKSITMPLSKEELVILILQIILY